MSCAFLMHLQARANLSLEAIQDFLPYVLSIISKSVLISFLDLIFILASAMASSFVSVGVYLRLAMMMLKR